MRHVAVFLLTALGFAAALGNASAAERTERYAVILTDAAAAEHFTSRTSMQSAQGASYRTQLLAAQASVRNEIANRGIRVTGAVQTVLNAVFVEAAPSRLNELRSLPGVKSVALLHKYRLSLNKAAELQNIAAAWSELGGESKAGAGVKIAMLDTGIDPTHPAFKNTSLTPPSGFPLCSSTDLVGKTAPTSWNCSDFTNGKIIVARSYVAMMAQGYFTPDGTTRPDDTSPRDHYGHGTATAMIAAGGTITSPNGLTITGFAPQAWLGVYRVFGSPGVNDFTGGQVLINAIDDAFNDGMDIAVLSLGSTATCDPTNGTCDAEAAAAETATRNGMLVVAAAGNDGDSGLSGSSTLGTVDSPATAPSVLAVGAITNSHTFDTELAVVGSSQSYQASIGSGPTTPSPVVAQVFDVKTVDSTGLACNALNANMNGKIALINRGTCTFLTKVTNAQAAGAIGVVFVDNTQEQLFSPSGLAGTGIPAVLISLTDGASLRSLLSSNPSQKVSLSTLPHEVSATPNQVAYFSSRGPSITYQAKPEVTGVGTDVYTATQHYDPNGGMYDESGYIAESGTSFSTPMLAGAAALVLQKNPTFTSAQLKSAVVSSATQDLTDPDPTVDRNAADLTAMGNGKLNAGDAVATTVTTDPAALSFGALGQTASVPVSRTLTLYCTSATTLSLSISGNNAPSLSKNSVACSGGSIGQQVTLTLSTKPAAGIYEGRVTVTGGSRTVRVPYMYVVGDGVASDIIPIQTSFDEPVGGTSFLGFRVIDQYGVAVQGATVNWRQPPVGSITNADAKTDSFGVATATANFGASAGTENFTATAGGLTIQSSGTVRAIPTVSTGGVVNAASFRTGHGIVPGSYISIFGSNLSDTTDGAGAFPLPLAISETSVAFDLPNGTSLPGRLLYTGTSDTGVSQINVQVPWELSGQSSASIRVNIGDTTGRSFAATVAKYDPAIYVNGTVAAALDASGNFITTANAAARGSSVQLFANGLGAVSVTPSSGEGAAASASTANAVSVTVGGKTAAVSSAKLVPGYPCVYEIDFTVPSDASTGSQSVVLSVAGVSSTAVNMPVR